MPKLTSKNYFTAANDYLTTSKIKDYIRDPWYYYQKHVLHTIKEEPSDAMIMGAGLDCLVMYGKKKFNKLYKPVARRTNAAGLKYTELTPAQYGKIVGMAARVMGTSAYEGLKEFKRQVILSKETPHKIAGTLDFLFLDHDDEEAGIVDLKSSMTIDPRKYFYHALDLGWFLQAAMYRKLVRANYPNIKIIKFFHITVEKDTLDLNRVQVFKFDESLLDKYTIILDDLIAEIYARKDFKPQDTSFAEAIVIGKGTPEAGWEESK